MPTLREIRGKNYISRKALAKESGVSESTIIRMEEGEKHTTEDVATRVLEALSAKIGERITIDNVDGLKIYNPMRDRKYPTKGAEEEKSKEAEKVA